jgi:lysozyme family protein
MSWIGRIFVNLLNLLKGAQAPQVEQHEQHEQHKMPKSAEEVKPETLRVRMSPTALQMWDLWVGAQVRPHRRKTVDLAAGTILRHRARYEAVAAQVNIPWYVIGVIHMRESSCNFSRNLANGQPLNQVTTIVPIGLGPWKTWEDSAIDILKRKGWHNVGDWHLASTLEHLERYNGRGYRAKSVTRPIVGDNRPINTPYLWALTNRYTVGKFVADGRYSPTHEDGQAGCAAIMLVLKERGENLNERYPLLLA